MVVVNIVSLLLNIVEYVVYTGFILLSVTMSYRFVTTEDQRVLYKNKLQKEIDLKIDEWLSKGKDTELQDSLSEIGIKYFTATVYQSVRLLFVLIIFISQVLLPLIVEGTWNSLSIVITLLAYVATEPKFKFSATSLVLKMLIENKRRHKIREVFTLFDILKAELLNMGENQDVNVYNLVRDVLPTLNHIQGTLAHFLSLWKRSPELAKDVFEDEIGGESAKVLGSVLYRLDSVSKSQALSLIKDESSVFTFSYYQGELRKSSGFSNIYFGFFMFVNVYILIWLVYFIYVMFNERMSNTNSGMF